MPAPSEGLYGDAADEASESAAPRTIQIFLQRPGALSRDLAPENHSPKATVCTGRQRAIMTRSVHRKIQNFQRWFAPGKRRTAKTRSVRRQIQTLSGPRRAGDEPQRCANGCRAFKGGPRSANDERRRGDPRAGGYKTSSPGRRQTTTVRGRTQGFNCGLRRIDDKP